MIVGRDENARLLGYCSHTAFRLEQRYGVAKTPAQINDLLDHLTQVMIFACSGVIIQNSAEIRKNWGASDNKSHDLPGRQLIPKVSRTFLHAYQV